jgi:hypothetical protein
MDGQSIDMTKKNGIVYVRNNNNNKRLHTFWPRPLFMALL